jgi:hypothetical protein
VADPLDSRDVEGSAVTGAQTGGVEVVDQVVVGHGRAEPFDHLDGRWWGALGGAGQQRPGHRHLVGGAGLPADPDADLVAVGLGEQGDVADQRAQQPFAVLLAGGGRVPELGQVGGQSLQVGSAGQRRQRLVGGRQRGLGLGQRGEFGLPAGLQAWKARSARSAS